MGLSSKQVKNFRHQVSADQIVVWPEVISYWQKYGN
jgi:hypothetical protein